MFYSIFIFFYFYFMASSSLPRLIFQNEQIFSNIKLKNYKFHSKFSFLFYFRSKTADPGVPKWGWANKIISTISPWCLNSDGKRTNVKFLNINKSSSKYAKFLNFFCPQGIVYWNYIVIPFLKYNLLYSSKLSSKDSSRQGLAHAARWPRAKYICQMLSQTGYNQSDETKNESCAKNMCAELYGNGMYIHT